MASSSEFQAGFVNAGSRSLWRWLTAAVVSVAAVGCGGPQRHLIYSRTIRVPDGRFVGPIELALPRRADHRERDFEITAELTAACGPRVRLSFPDGEVASVGDDDDGWQALLARRAEAPEGAATASGSGSVGADPPGAGPGAQTGGHRVRVQTESWPGQLAFLEARARRCVERRRYRRSYLNAFDASGRLTLWAETPQEIAGATLTVTVHELIEDDEPAPASVAVAAAAAAEVRVEARPVPPRPKPKLEAPGQPKAAGARWRSGQWVYQDGEGRWVWHRGQWDAPASQPGTMAERTGAPPVQGCTWKSGYWTWESGDGSWLWVAGEWDPPPPRSESPGTPPVPEQSWIAGSWARVGASFEWRAGRWGRPTPRAETPPAPPHAGAHWVAGTWMYLGGSWTWSPGFYEQSDRPPPARKAETPTARPAPGAVWLAGFWRWDVSGKRYAWVAGHWELPPGEGYVWVADPPVRTGEPSISGRWVLEVDLKVVVPRPRGRR